MGISRSAYYYRPKKNLKKAKRDADIADAIEEVATEFPSYGYRRITAALKRRDMAVNHKKVLKMMKEMGIQCRKRRRFVSTTDSRHNLRVYPNLAKDLVLDRTDKLWCAAIPIYAFLPALYTWQRLLIHFQDT
jgi:putative transposase